MKLYPTLIDFTFTRDDGSTDRSITVASNHPQLYRLAQESEQSGDRDMMRAVVRAATQDVPPIELTVLPTKDAE